MRKRYNTPASKYASQAKFPTQFNTHIYTPILMAIFQVNLAAPLTINLQSSVPLRFSHDWPKLYIYILCDAKHGVALRVLWASRYIILQTFINGF